MAEKEKLFKRVGLFLADIKSELKKVTWPNKDDMQKTTIAVVVASVLFGVYLFGVDMIFSQMIDWIIGAFN
jgi:preprotein translocase subunit SecE